MPLFGNSNTHSIHSRRGIIIIIDFDSFPIYNDILKRPSIACCIRVNICGKCRSIINNHFSRSITIRSKIIMLIIVRTIS